MSDWGAAMSLFIFSFPQDPFPVSALQTSFLRLAATLHPPCSVTAPALQQHCNAFAATVQRLCSGSASLLHRQCTEVATTHYRHVEKTKSIVSNPKEEYYITDYGLYAPAQGRLVIEIHLL